MSRVAIFGLFALLFGLTGCASEKDYVEAFRAQRAAWRELADVLANIRDEKSMADATEALEVRFEKFESVAVKVRALPKPSAEILAKLQQDQTAMQHALADLQYEVRRVRGLPGGPAFLKKFESKSPGLLSAEQP